jgi:predicted ester cyclase
LRGIAPTNKAIKVEGMVINRISRGRIAESWVNWDALGLIEQLGVVTTLERAKGQAAK